LRPNLLSIYKDDNETKLRHKVLLSDLTAVAFLKDPKQKRHNVFGLFSPSRNYHLQAASKQDAEEWVQLIRKEARIEEEEEEMLLASPVGNVTGGPGGLEQEMQKQKQERQMQEERLASSSPEPTEPLPRLPKARNSMANGERRPSHTIEYSGNEPGSHSEGSDGDSHPQRDGAKAPALGDPSGAQALDPKRPMPPGRNVSQMSGINVEQDQERVVWQSHLLYLRSKGGVRQWKDLWAVLRPKNFALYKDEGEYLPQLIIPLCSIINVVEIDPISRTKTHCMQIITEEKSYRFCAHSEESLDKTLGAFKSLLVKRKENEGKRPAGPR
jgi:PH domain